MSLRARAAKAPIVESGAFASFAPTAKGTGALRGDRCRR